MTTPNHTTIRAATHEPRASGPARLRTVTSIIVHGHLAWLRYVWAGLATLLLVILSVQWARGGGFTESVWEQIGVGVQRWVIFGAGVTTVPVFAPLVVSQGVTRRAMSHASFLAAAAIAITGTLVVVAGYLAERAVYAGANWTHASGDGSNVLAADTIGRDIVASALIFAAYLVSGWIIGIGFYRAGAAVGMALIVPGVIPLLAVDALMSAPNNPIGAFDIVQERLDRLGELQLWVSVPVSIVILAVAALVARRATVGVAIKN